MSTITRKSKAVREADRLTALGEKEKELLATLAEITKAREEVANRELTAKIESVSAALRGSHLLQRADEAQLLGLVRLGVLIFEGSAPSAQISAADLSDLGAEYTNGRKRRPSKPGKTRTGTAATAATSASNTTATSDVGAVKADEGLDYADDGDLPM